VDSSRSWYRAAPDHAPSSSSSRGTAAGSSARSTCIDRPLEVPPGSLPAQVSFPATGRRFELRLPGGEGPVRLTAGETAIRITGGAGRPALVRHALQRFAMREAHAALGPWLAQLSAATGLTYMQCRSGASARAGAAARRAARSASTPASCSSRRPVVNYLLLHELAHTRHMNHSRRFWRLVERFEPDWRELDAALTRGWREVPSGRSAESRVCDDVPAA
jgi:predicted metal-dependent hydrolase